MGRKAFDLNDVALAADRAAREAGLRYYIGGYYAAGVWLGVKMYRATFDVDITVFAESTESMVKALEKRGLEVVRSRGAATRVGFPGTPFYIDVFQFNASLLGPRGEYLNPRLLEEIQARARPFRVKGRALRIARPEDVVVLKTVSLKLGYGDKHRADIRRLLRLEKLDRDLLRKTLKKHGLFEEFARAAAERRRDEGEEEE